MEIIIFIFIGIVLLLLICFIFKKHISKINFELPFFKANIETKIEEQVISNRRKFIANQMNANPGKSLADPDQTKVIVPRDVNYYKEYAKILFIDDLDWSDKIKNLKEEGWKNVLQITDTQNLDRIEIREANIIFVDYKGVGKDLKDEGVDVIVALKKRYKDNKWIILYSAENVPISATLDKRADSSLAKNSSIYEFEQKILEGLGKVNI